jgi:hypothetical protein
MENTTTEFLKSAHRKFSTFRELSEQFGEIRAWEKMLEGFPEQQKQRMGPLITGRGLAKAFRKSIPFFESIGMKMDVVDISNRQMDAALEIQRYCPYLEICGQYGFDIPCHVICEMDIEASKRAFPEMKGEILCRQATGSCVCVFKYERPAEVMYRPAVSKVVERWAADKPENPASGKPSGYYRLTAYLTEYLVRKNALPTGVHTMPEGRDSQNRIEPSFPVDFDEITGDVELPER